MPPSIPTRAQLDPFQSRRRCVDSTFTAEPVLCVAEPCPQQRCRCHQTPPRARTRVLTHLHCVSMLPTQITHLSPYSCSLFPWSSALFSRRYSLLNREPS
ncbi:hypothetical protein M0R45_018098 [Rubus argutus]|uniref:Uncharacterized protein n=1 Tax=Rubus argutus TaxID=59490 RepID=A0AAW1X1E6_RUBAR